MQRHEKFAHSTRQERSTEAEAVADRNPGKPDWNIPAMGEALRSAPPSPVFDAVSLRMGTAFRLSEQTSLVVFPDTREARLNTPQIELTLRNTTPAIGPDGVVFEAETLDCTPNTGPSPKSTPPTVACPPVRSTHRVSWRPFAVAANRPRRPPASAGRAPGGVAPCCTPRASSR